MTGPYQTPSDRPGSDGWPGGDINSPFGPSDPTSSPYPPGSGSAQSKEEEEPSPYQGVQYSLDAPGGQPMTQPPPYSPVTGPPMNNNPATGVPMGPPPGYRPPPPPGYQQQFAPPMRPASNNNGWIIGGVVAGVVVLLLIAGIFVIANSVGGGNGGSDATYTYQSDLCSKLDVSKYSAQDPTLGAVESSGYDDYVSCSADAELGSLWITVDYYEDNEAATTNYSSTKSNWMTSTSNARSESGSWSEAELADGSGYTGDGDVNVIMVARADNMVMVISFYSFDAASPDQQGGFEAIKATATQIMDLSKA